MKTRNSKRVIQFLALLTLGACASAKIYENEDGSTNAVFRGDSRSEAMNMTLKGAQKHCKEQGKTLVVVNHDAQYEGAMDEGANSAIKGVARAASILGSHEAGAIGYGVTADNKYNGVMKFRCK